MIELRRKLERARAHPVLGPLVLIVLVLVLAMVFMHGVHDSHEVATDFGAVCIALATAFTFVVLVRVIRLMLKLSEIHRVSRAPPRVGCVARVRPRIRPDVPLYLPLRL